MSVTKTNHVICTMSVTNIIHVIYVQITWFIAQNKALGQRYRCGHTTRPRKHNLRYKPGPPYFFESCTECTHQIIKRFNNEPGINNNCVKITWGQGSGAIFDCTKLGVRSKEAIDVGRPMGDTSKFERYVSLWEENLNIYISCVCAHTHTHTWHTHM